MGNIENTRETIIDIDYSRLLDAIPERSFDLHRQMRGRVAVPERVSCVKWFPGVFLRNAFGEAVLRNYFNSRQASSRIAVWV